MDFAGDGRVEPGATGTDEKRNVVGAGRVVNEPGGDGVADGGQERDDAFLAAFAQDAETAGSGGTEMADVEGKRFGDPETGPVQ